MDVQIHTCVVLSVCINFGDIKGRGIQYFAHKMFFEVFQDRSPHKHIVPDTLSIKIRRQRMDRKKTNQNETRKYEMKEKETKKKEIKNK